MRDLKLISAIAVSFAIVFLSGCGRQASSPPGKELVAKIGDYEMTADDFRDEIKLAGYALRLPEDPREARLKLLSEVVTRKTLVQEAVRQELEKDRSFMAEIERYWEQALLKQLFNKKMRELAATTRVYDVEVRRRYDSLAVAAAGRIKSFEEMAPEIRRELFNEKVQGSLDAWMADLEKKNSVRVYEENLEKIELRR